MRFVVGRISTYEQFEAGSHFYDIFGYFGVAAFFPAKLSRVELVENHPAFTVPECAIDDGLNGTCFVRLDIGNIRIRIRTPEQKKRRPTCHPKGV